MVEKVMQFTPKIGTADMTNHFEYRSFLKTALAWKGSVTPKILPRVGWVGIYSAALVWVMSLLPDYDFDLTPFEYTGAVLGLLLVARVNAGVDRWWEARKLWGSIVNQSRNLAIIGYQNSDQGDLARKFLNWVAVWPHVMRGQLRDDRETKRYAKIVGARDAEKISKSQHRAVYVGFQIAQILKRLRKKGLDDFSFHRADRERSMLIDAIGACERIRSTPIPFVLAIKTRRFIFLFLMLLPFALIAKVGWMTPFIVMLTSYPLFCLDQIGIELQNPFSLHNLSHLPLNTICQNIENNVLALPDYVAELDQDEDESEVGLVG